MRGLLLLLLLLLLGFAPVFLYSKTAYEIDLYGNLTQLAALGIAGYSFLRIQNSHSILFRRACSYLTVGIWIWGVGQVMVTYSELVLNSSPYGTVSSSFFVIGYLSIFFACICFLKDLEPGRSRVLTLSMICTLSFVACFIFLYNEITDPHRSTIFKFLDVAYSAFDFMILSITALLVISAARAKNSIRLRAFGLFFCAFGILAIMDVLVTDVYFETMLYRAVDIAYVACYVLITLSGYTLGQIDYKQLTTDNV